MKVLIIARGYPSEKYKMNGIFEYDQAKALKQAGHDVVYLAVDVRSIRRTRKWGYESFSRDGIAIRVLNVPGGRVPELFLSKLSQWGLKKLYLRTLKEFGAFDIIHAHFLNVSYSASIVLTQLKDTTKFVITEHTSSLNVENIESSDFIKMNYAYSRCDALIAVSEPFCKRLNKLGGEWNAVCIPNIVDLSCFRPSQEEKHDGFNIISVGGLTKIKRMSLLLEGFSTFHSKYKDTKLIIIGEGPERRNLENIITKNKLGKVVQLLGLCSRDRINHEMESCDCFALVSRAETFGVAYTEALAAGLPVIATKCGGPEDFVNDENGMLIEVDNIESIEIALMEMYKNISRYNKRRIAEETKKKFNPMEIAQRLEKIYSELI